ncbi:MAG: PilZ domain-containing protein [Myxococcales bacterium]|nr:PilZ domain-containing protein [Myxococcales bacterium]
MNEEGPVGAVELYVMGASMRTLHGQIVRRDGEELWVSLDGGALHSGEAVCLQTDSEAPWLYGKVLERESIPGPSVSPSETPVSAVGTVDCVKIHIDGTHTPDRREFSRVWGPLHLRFQVTTDQGHELASLRWLRHGQGIGRAWLRPPMFMDFSGSGARFEVRDELPCKPNDRLLVGLRVPGDDSEHRLTARVVRSLQDDTQVAIHFLECSPGAISALVDFAERIQEQMVELLGEPDVEGSVEGLD